MSGFEAPYPGYDILAKWDSPSFNDQTRRVLKARLEAVPERRFFTLKEWDVLEALCDTVLPQPDRQVPVPIAPFIDDALYRGLRSGTRFEDMPPTQRAWRQGLSALDAEARARRGARFDALSQEDRAALLEEVDAGEVVAPEWEGLPPQRFFRELVLREAVSIYYVHPAGQSEIGFGGPASPRGYVRLGGERRDGWEAPPRTTAENGRLEE